MQNCCFSIQTFFSENEWLVACITTLAGGFLGGYFRYYFERKQRAEEAERLRELLYRDLTRSFLDFMTLYDNIYWDKENLLIPSLDAWTNRKKLLHGRLDSPAFEYARGDARLFGQISDFDRLYVCYKNFASLIETDEMEPWKFSYRMRATLAFFENEFKQGLIDQSLVIQYAGPQTQRKLAEMRDGKRQSISPKIEESMSEALRDAGSEMEGDRQA